jgi:hypothetical protein
MSIFIRFFLPVFMVIFFFWALFLRTFVQYKKTKVNPLTFGRHKESAPTRAMILPTVPLISNTSFP